MAISAPPVGMPITGKADAGKAVGEEESLCPLPERVREGAASMQISMEVPQETKNIMWSSYITFGPYRKGI